MSETMLNQLIKKLNAAPKGNGWWLGLCPLHNDTRPSLVFNQDGFICMSCGREGKLEELSRVDILEVEGESL